MDTRLWFALCLVLSAMEQAYSGSCSSCDGRFAKDNCKCLQTVIKTPIPHKLPPIHKPLQSRLKLFGLTPCGCSKPFHPLLHPLVHHSPYQHTKLPPYEIKPFHLGRNDEPTRYTMNEPTTYDVRDSRNEFVNPNHPLDQQYSPGPPTQHPQYPVGPTHPPAVHSGSTLSHLQQYEERQPQFYPRPDPHGYPPLDEYERSYLPPHPPQKYHSREEGNTYYGRPESRPYNDHGLYKRSFMNHFITDTEEPRAAIVKRSYSSPELNDNDDSPHYKTDEVSIALAFDLAKKLENLIERGQRFGFLPVPGQQTTYDKNETEMKDERTPVIGPKSEENSGTVNWEERMTSYPDRFHAVSDSVSSSSSMDGTRLAMATTRDSSWEAASESRELNPRPVYRPFGFN